MLLPLLLLLGCRSWLYDPGPRKPEAPEAKQAAQQLFDREHPCFVRGQVQQATQVLFAPHPDPHSERWARALNLAFYQLGIPCHDDGFLVLVLTLVQMESGAQADPPLANRDLEALFVFKADQLRQEQPLLAEVLARSGLETALRERLRADTQRGQVRSEGDLVHYVEAELRPWLAAHLEAEYYVPPPLAHLAATWGLENPVTTLGPLQVNVSKAFRNARSRGDGPEQEAALLRELLAPETALERGLKEGIDQLWRGYHYYSAHLPEPEAVRFAAADYNAGEFSSRNAAFQERVARLSGLPLQLDGDLLRYRDGAPSPLPSNSEQAVRAILRGRSAAGIRGDLLLEKSAQFDTTRTFDQVCRDFEERFAEPCALAHVPDGADNPSALAKLGRSYSPANYARAAAARWQSNREAYGTP